MFFFQNDSFYFLKQPPVDGIFNWIIHRWEKEDRPKKGETRQIPVDGSEILPSPVEVGGSLSHYSQGFVRYIPGGWCRIFFHQQSLSHFLGGQDGSSFYFKGNLLEQWSFHPGWLGYIGDEILPSYIGTMIRHYKDHHQSTRISWNVTRVLITAHFVFVCLGWLLA